MSKDSAKITVKKKLLVVAGRLGVGGAERFTSTLLQFLDRDLYEIHLCLGLDCLEYELPEDIGVSFLYHTNELHYFRTVIRLRKLIAQFGPDIVLSTIGQCNRWIGGALYGNRKNILWVARIGNNPSQGGRSGWRNRINIFLDKLAYKKTDRFVLNSFCLEKLFHQVHPSTVGRTVVIYNPTDFQVIREKSRIATEQEKLKGTKVIVHAGRFHRQKRHDLLLDGFALLQQKYGQRKVELWLLGDGYLREAIEKKIETLELNSSVQLLGHQPNPYAIFRKADIVVLCSDWEGMPNVLVEAMGLRIPVVSTSCDCGPGELIAHTGLGFLCNPGDENELAEKMALALNLDNRDETVTRAEQHVHELFDFRINMAAWQQVLG